MNKEHRYLQRLQERAASLAAPDQAKLMTYDDYDHMHQALDQVFGHAAAKSFTQLCCYLKDGRALTVRQAVHDLYAHGWLLLPVLDIQDCLDQEKTLGAFSKPMTDFMRTRHRAVDRYHLHYAAKMDAERYRFLRHRFLQLSLEQKNSLPAQPSAPHPLIR